MAQSIDVTKMAIRGPSGERTIPENRNPRKKYYSKTGATITSNIAKTDGMVHVAYNCLK